MKPNQLPQGPTPESLVTVAREGPATCITYTKGPMVVEINVLPVVAVPCLQVSIATGSILSRITVPQVLLAHGGLLWLRHRTSLTVENPIILNHIAQALELAAGHLEALGGA